jgi:L,D-peptidoglycan transpeptidase YkuD (ErfK/YbiS/YcfS/YnhG family)
MRSRGVLIAGRLAIPVVLGRAGIRANKREGDGATPQGRFRLRRLWWRADRRTRPPTLLPTVRIDRRIAWCEDPSDRRYNRPFRRSANEPGDRLWRDDRLYDIIIEIDHNTRPRVARRGSTVFLHLARPERSPTAGCVAFSAPDLRRLLARLGPNTRLLIQA